MEEEVEALIKLSGIKGVGEAKLSELISRFRPIAEIFDAPNHEISELVGTECATAIKKAKSKRVEPELSLMQKLGAKIATFEDPSYPSNLKLLPDTPPLLYIRGEILPCDQESIAIIGSRRSSLYGKLTAENFASEFAQAGITVISGLARGIDTCAHQKTLKSGGRTIAVLGCGIDVVYPPENRELMDEIIAHGACISEFPLGTQPWGGNFPTRNRLISGLSRAVVIIEASLQSGIFSTVEWALGQGKEVFAVPGNITSETSKGTNKLIMDGAIPVTSPEDVLGYMGIKPVGATHASPLLSEDESKVFALLSYEPRQVDNLANTLEFRVPKILGILLNLELRGIVKQLPGRNFIRTIQYSL